MSTTQPCVYKTISLAAGEQFVLPPGAEIVSTSVEGALTSENDCLDLTKIETTKCYFFATGTVDGDNDGKSEYWEDGQSNVYGFQYGDIKVGGYNIPSTPGYDMDSVYNMIAATLPITYVGTFYNDGPGGNDSRQSGLVFKMIPSIADNLSLLIVAYANMDGSPAYYTCPAREYVEGINQGIQNFPSCS